MQKIVPFFWFNDNAEEAANVYVTLFKNSKVTRVVRYDDAAAKVSGRPKGSVMSVTFTLNGQEFYALNGGPHYTLTPAASMYVKCADQAELDRLWEKLGQGGEIMMCGWLTDRFGLTWQIVPEELDELLNGPDAEAGRRAMDAVLTMKKLDLDAIRAAFDGR